MTDPQTPTAASKNPPTEPRNRRNRSRSYVVVGVLLGAAVAMGAGLLVWVSQRYGIGSVGSLSRKGSDVVPSLIPLSLVALAGLVASFAGRGVMRRVIGGAVVLAGLGLAAVALSPLLHPPANAASGDTPLPAPAALMGPVTVHPLGPVLAAVGGLLIAVAGGAVVAGVGRSMGSRYDSPTGRSAGVGASVSEDVRDADAAAAWWKALDAGADPTEEAPPNTSATPSPAPPTTSPIHAESPTKDPDAGTTCHHIAPSGDTASTRAAQPSSAFGEHPPAPPGVVRTDGPGRLP